MSLAGSWEYLIAVCEAFTKLSSTHDFHFWRLMDRREKGSSFVRMGLSADAPPVLQFTLPIVSTSAQVQTQPVAAWKCHGGPSSVSACEPLTNAEHYGKALKHLPLAVCSEWTHLLAGISSLVAKINKDWNNLTINARCFMIHTGSCCLVCLVSLPMETPEAFEKTQLSWTAWQPFPGRAGRHCSTKITLFN